MKLEKAIELLCDIIRFEYSASHSDKGDAIKLSLQALNRHKNRDTTTFKGMMAPLPGETEE